MGAGGGAGGGVAEVGAPFAGKGCTWVQGGPGVHCTGSRIHFGGPDFRSLPPTCLQPCDFDRFRLLGNLKYISIS